MNRLVATIYFVRSAWSAGALIPTIWHGSSSLSHRTSTVVANHKPFQPHGSAPSSTGVLSLSQSRSQSPSLSLSTASNTESAGTESPSPVAAAAAAATRKDGSCCCIDEKVVRRLLSGAEFERMDALVRERSRARSEGNYTLADELKDEITGFAAGLVGRDGGGEGGGGFELFLRDIPRKSGGGSRWTLVPAARPLDEEFLSGTRILQLAHTAMGLAVEDNHHQQSQQQSSQQSSQQQRTTEQTRRNRRKKSLESLVEQARGRLEILLEETRTMEANTATLDADIEISTKQTMVRNELGGRTAADAALWFALAGCRDTALFHGLADIASWELNRFGQRPSCRSKNIYQILERFAAAGLKRHEKLEQIALECLLEKEKEEQQQKEQRGERGAAGVESDGDGDDKTPSSLLLLNLHSDRSLLLIWKFASKQKKQQAFLRTAKKNWEQYREAEMGNEIPTETVADSIIHVEGTATHQNERGAESPYNWGDMFEDASRPLVVDVGCGMGVSLLGLASTTTTDRGASEQESARLLLGQNMKWSDCNFVGVDLGALGIEYSRGVAHRWNAEGNLQFVIDAAEDFCQHLQSYPGEIRCCMIQFPTPFRLQNKDGGNSQLPASKLEGFMVTENLLQTIHSSLDPKHGKLLLQSNCEDVAVWMRDLACRTVGFTALDDDDDREEPPHQGSIPQRIPQRTQDWIAMGGERAEGRGWFRRNILHRRGATETEATCAINGTPIHRCLLRVDQ